jgi:hypothetical protein
VLECAHDAADLEADLLAALGLHRERRPPPQTERVGEPDAHLDLAGAAQPPPVRQRRRLEDGVVAGVGDHPQRLAEPERVGDLHLVALGGGGDARYRLDRRDVERIQADSQLVALADGARIVPEPVEQRGQRQHQGHYSGADGDRRDRRQVAPARRGGEACAGREQPVTKAAPACASRRSRASAYASRAR